jgi:hypothetical protein
VEITENPFDTVDGGSDMTLKEALWHACWGVSMFLTVAIIVCCLICHEKEPKEMV